jgi:hypothetical protein
MIIYSRCTCGARMTAATRDEAWAALDAHIEAEHGRTFPTSVIGHVLYDSSVRHSTKRAPKRTTA